MSSSWPPSDFPNLKEEEYRKTSDSSLLYNCIAWAAEDTTTWWWPDDPDIGYGYWPQGVERRDTVEVFASVFQTLGYEICDSGSLETGFEKVAIFALSRKVTHAARQLPNGCWTSKLGSFEDIEHVDLACLEGPLYGAVSCFMKRLIGG